MFLSNGARLYLDVGSHPEYATPECDCLIDLVAHDKAGERILEGLLVDAEKRLHEEGIAGDIYLFKNNTDSAGNSYGCHENYLVGRHGEFGRLADVLIPFLVTRQLICGAGKVLQTPRGAVYCVSQRAEHIWEGVSSATTRRRPIINTRDEPHADAERYRRLHVIVGDSNMNESTMLLKVGSADLVLRMIEAGVVIRDLTLENPIRAIREISHDLTGRRRSGWPPAARSARWRSSSEYLSQGPASSSSASGGDVTKRVLELWGRDARRGRDRRPRLIDREIDWVTKYQLIERYRAKTTCRCPRRGSPSSTSPTTTSPAPAGVLPAAARGAVERVVPRSGDLRGQVRAAADDPRQAARRLHPAGPGAAPRLHRRLGAPQAQRPGPAHRAVQGPVPVVDERVEKLIAGM